MKSNEFCESSTVPSYLRESVGLDALSATADRLGWQIRYAQLHRRPLRAVRSLGHAPGVQLGVCGYNDATAIRGAIPAETVLLFTIPRDEVLWSDKGVFRSRYDLHLVTDREEIDFCQNGACTHYMAVFDRKLLVERLAIRFGEKGPKLLENGKLRVRPEDLDAFRSRIESWLDLFRRHALKQTKLRHAFLENEILETLLECVRWSNEPGHIETSHRLFERARDVLHQNIRNHFGIRDLALALQVSERSLQYLFKKRLGVTPRHYFQSIRMNAIRRILREGGEGVRVGDVALEHGFLHLGHFVEQYKRYFGELPSQTLKKA